MDQIFIGSDFVAGEPVDSTITGTLNLDGPGTYYLIIQLATYGVSPEIDNLNDTIGIFEFEVIEVESADLQITSIGTRPTPPAPTMRPTHRPTVWCVLCSDLNPNPVPLDSEGFVVEYTVTNTGNLPTDTTGWYDDVYIFPASGTLYPHTPSLPVFFFSRLSLA